VSYRSALALFATAMLLAAPVVAQVTDATNASLAPAGALETPLYTVVDGDKVDANSMKGWRTWRAMACERCHGPNQEGLVGPSLVNSLKVLTKEQFRQTLMNGRPEKGMPNFGEVKTVVDNLDNLYTYLKGRSDGAIKPGHLHEIDK
jgi:mono/diheme cytochrome c family protein